MHKGHNHGKVIIEDYEKDNDDGGDEDGPENVAIPFINENLVVEATYKSGETKVYSDMSYGAIQCCHSRFFFIYSRS